MPVIIAHKGFHAAENGAVLVTETGGDLPLQSQGQDIARVLLLVVKLGPDAQEKVISAIELLALGRGDQLRIDELLGIGESAFDLPDPEQILVVAQATAPILDVRFLKENGVACFLMPFALIGYAPIEEFLFMSTHATTLEGLFKFLEERFIAGKKAGLEERGLRPQIAVGLGDDLLHGAGGMAHLEANVPEDIQNVLNDVVGLLRIFGAFVGVEKKDVDVTVGIEFAPAESTHGEQGDAGRFFGVKTLVGFPRSLPEMTQHHA